MKMLMILTLSLFAASSFAEGWRTAPVNMSTYGGAPVDMKEDGCPADILEKDSSAGLSPVKYDMNVIEDVWGI